VRSGAETQRLHRARDFRAIATARSAKRRDEDLFGATKIFLARRRSFRRDEDLFGATKIGGRRTTVRASTGSHNYRSAYEQ
jgi:hypothetical protein